MIPQIYNDLLLRLSTTEGLEETHIDLDNGQLGNDSEMVLPTILIRLDDAIETETLSQGVQLGTVRVAITYACEFFLNTALGSFSGAALATALAPVELIHKALHAWNGFEENGVLTGGTRVSTKKLQDVGAIMAIEQVFEFTVTDSSAYTGATLQATGVWFSVVQG